MVQNRCLPYPTEKEFGYWARGIDMSNMDSDFMDQFYNLILNKMSKEDLQTQLEALKIENQKLKQQLNSTRLEKAMLAFGYLPEEEKSAVRMCYDFI